MENVQEKYTRFHKEHASHHLYPTEWVIRTMLGRYPDLKLNKENYKGGKILDLGFGDGRNMSLLANCGLNIHGVEITEDAVKLVKESMTARSIPADLRVGSNSKIPFDDGVFDYILASSSCYYVDGDDSFDDNMKEIKRVLKPGGWFIANFPAFVNNDSIEPSFILNNAEQLGDGHVIIKNDIYGIRNGYKFRAFDSVGQIRDYFNKDFVNVSCGVCLDNYYGVQINQYLLTAEKK